MRLRHGGLRLGVLLVLVVVCVLGVADSAFGAATAYVTNEGGNTVTPIKVASNTPGPEIPVGSIPEAVAITPDGKTAYVANEGGNTVTPIEVASNTPGTEIAVGSNPLAVAITSDGKTAYVANWGSGTVTPIEVATNKPGPGIPVGSNPAAVAITASVPTATCTNINNQQGTITLSPGLTNTAVYQGVKVKGTLIGCTGEPFTEAKYTATLTTTSKVTCSALSGPGTAMFGSVKYVWTPKTKATTGTFSLPLTETAGIALSSELESGPYSPLTLSGTASESYTNAAICGVPQGKKGVIKAVTKGTFSGSAVNFE